MLLKVFKLIFAVVFINRFHSTKFSLKTTDSFHFNLNSGLKFVLALAHNFFITVKKWLLDSLSGFRNSLPRCPVKRSVLKNFTSFTGKQLCWNLFLINLEVFRPALYWREIPTQVLSCEIRGIFKNTCEQLPLWFIPVLILERHSAVKLILLLFSLECCC